MHLGILDPTVKSNSTIRSAIIDLLVIKFIRINFRPLVWEKIMIFGFCIIQDHVSRDPGPLGKIQLDHQIRHHRFSSHKNFQTKF